MNAHDAGISASAINMHIALCKQESGRGSLVSALGVKDSFLFFRASVLDTSYASVSISTSDAGICGNQEKQAGRSSGCSFFGAERPHASEGVGVTGGD